MITRLLAALLALSAVLSGCAGRKLEETSRRVLAVSAITIAETEEARISYQEARDRECREIPGVTFPAWRACMEPAYKLDRSVAAYRGILLAAEATVDATGADGWAAIAPCVIEAAENLHEALAEARIPIPEEVGIILSLGGSVAGECSP